MRPIFEEEVEEFKKTSWFEKVAEVVLGAAESGLEVPVEVGPFRYTLSVP